MSLSLKYTGHSFWSSELFVRCVWSEVPNTAWIVGRTGHNGCWTIHNHRTYNKIQLTYLFISPPVAWFPLSEDAFLSFMEFLCWSIPQMFPQHGLLHEELNPFNTIAVQNVCNHHRESYLDQPNDYNTLCQISKCRYPSCRTFRSTFWIQCGTKWRCWRLPS